MAGAEASGPPSIDPEGIPGRRRVLRIGAGSALGISTVALPAAAVAASASEVQSWSGTLTFSDVSETGFTVTWTGV